MAGIGVNAGDGQNIFELATRIQRMGLDELRKIPADELRQNVVSGAETGSTKWLSDFNNFYGLANQLKVKSGIQSVDNQDINSIVESQFYEYKNSRLADRALLKSVLALELHQKKDVEQLMMNSVDKFKQETDILKRRFLIEIASEVWNEKFRGDIKGKSYKETLRLLLASIIAEQVVIKTGSPDTTSQKIIFNTLSKVDSSIANLIQQLTSSNEFLLNILKPRRSAWSTEISDAKLGALKEDATTIKQNFVQTSASPEIANYKEVFVRLTKKYDELFLLIKGINSESPISTDGANLAFNVNRP